MQAPTPAAQTAPAAPGAAPLAPAGATGRASAAEIYRAFQAQRSELDDQMRSLEGRRNEFLRVLQTPNLPAVDRAGLEKRVLEFNGRISDLDKQIAAADADVARSAAVPGATVQPPRIPRPGPPAEAYGLGALFIVIVFLPLSIAFARRIWRRSAAVTAKVTTEISERMSSIEQAVGAVAVEVERIGEGQRFVTRLLAEDGRRSLDTVAAEPIVLRQREGAPESRR